MAEALNLTGMLCPMPVLRTKKALAKLAPGQELTVHTDDPHAVEDLALFAQQSGHTLVRQTLQPDGRITEHVLRHKE